MNFFEYMKHSRERVGLTQAQAAEKIGVSITAIQKWEKDQLPTSQFWGTLMKTYGLNEREFGEKIVAASSSKDSAEKEEEPAFPSFLFSKSQLEELEKMVLTEEEQELLGLECLYGTEFPVDSDGNVKPSELPQNLPYEYIKKLGSFKIRQLHQSLEEKLGRNRAFVIEYLTNHPDFLFDIHQLPDNAIKQLLSFIRWCRDELRERTLLDYVIRIARILQKIDENSGEIQIAYTDSSGNYKTDLYQDNFYLFNVDIWTQTMDSKFPRYLLVENRESTENDYLAKKCQYEKDLAFYNEHKNVLDCYFPREPRYCGSSYAKMTEEGRNLLNWCRRNNIISSNT